MTKVGPAGDGVAPGGFRAGTAILTERSECPVEALRVGERVVTAFGMTRRVRWLGRRSYLSRFVAGGRAVLPVLIRRGALARNRPAHDLYVAPGHALLVRDALVPAGLLINGSSILQTGVDDPLTYVHVALDTHDILLAEGVPIESYIDLGHRGLFHHAAPGAAPEASSAARFPLLTAGPELQAIRVRLADRVREVEQGQAGELIGHLDAADAQQVRGWAWQADHPDEPVLLEVLRNRAVAGTVLANLCRPDVRDSGLGTGQCGFAFSWPRPLPAHVPTAVEVRRLSDGAGLAGSPRMVTLPEKRPRKGFWDDHSIG